MNSTEYYNSSFDYIRLFYWMGIVSYRNYFKYLVIDGHHELADYSDE